MIIKEVSQAVLAAEPSFLPQPGRTEDQDEIGLFVDRPFTDRTDEHRILKRAQTIVEQSAKDPFFEIFLEQVEFVISEFIDHLRKLVCHGNDSLTPSF